MTIGSLKSSILLTRYYFWRPILEYSLNKKTRLVSTSVTVQLDGSVCIVIESWVVMF